MTDDTQPYDPGQSLLERARAGSAKALSLLSVGQQRMAYRFAAEHAGRFLFCQELGWLHWTGSRWEPDATTYARRAVSEMLIFARQDVDPENVKAATVCMSSSGHKGILEIAATLSEFYVKLEELDSDPYLINLSNGTYDLRTSQLMPHDPSDYITKITRAAFNENASGEVWSEHLSYFQPDSEIRSFLQRFFGYSLLGKVAEHILLIAYGPQGANGKGTTDRAIQYALGDYATSANQNLLVATRSNSADAPSPARFALLGRRYVSMSETEKRAPIAEALMKNLTGGDTISARALHRDEVTFEPSHTLVLYTNHKPKLSGDDSGVWRRVKLVPFNITRPLEEQDSGIDDKLRLEADAVLSWMLAGYAMWAEQGLNPPASVSAATAEYQYEEDGLGQFIAERLSVDTTAKTLAKEIHDEWTAFAYENQLAPATAKELYLRLENEGYTRKKRSQGYVFLGVALKIPTETPTEEMLDE